MEIAIRSSIPKSFNPNRLSLDTIQQASKRVLDIKPQNKQFVDLNSSKDQDDEGEIMLLAKILVQLQGQSPTDSPSASPCQSSGESDADSHTSDQETSSIESPESSLNKKKRQRTSPDQLLILEEIFETDRMPNPQTRGHLADQLGMSSRRVQIWFQNKRAKVKREVSGAKSPDVPSPSSSPSVPTSDEVPSSPTGAAVVPQMNSPKPSPLAAQVPTIVTPSVSATNSFLPTSTMLPAAVPMAGTILDNTSKQLKAQQRQFSRVAPFIDTQPVLTASY